MNKYYTIYLHSYSVEECDENGYINISYIYQFKRGQNLEGYIEFNICDLMTAKDNIVICIKEYIADNIRRTYTGSNILFDLNPEYKWLLTYNELLERNILR